MKVSIKENDDRDRRIEHLYKVLEEEGVGLPGVSPDINPDLKPIWYDEELFKKGQRFSHKYLISVNMSHLMGLLLVMQLPRGLAPLLAMKNHDSVPKLFKRYLGTQQKVRSWYESDPFDVSSEAYATLRQVRSMHVHVCKVMNSKTGRIIGQDGNIWVSQYDMSMTLWAFIGIIILFPKECGCHTASKEEFESLIFFWRVMGYLNGIEDRFNMCSGNYEETYCYFQLIWLQVYKPVLMTNPHPAPTGYDMTKGIILALRCFNPSIKWVCFMKYWYNVLDIPVEFTIESPRNRLRYRMMRFSLGTLLRANFFHWMYGSIFRWNRKRILNRKDQQEQWLKEQFPDINYSKCPYGFDLDNLDQHQV